MGCWCLYLCSYLRSCCEVTARFLVSPEESIRRKRRLVWGIAVLLLVDVLWVGSSELTDLIFHAEGFDKPFFTTYFKTSAFMLYLTGFLFYEPWRQQCLLCLTKAEPDVEVSGPTDVCCNHVRENTSLLHTPSSSRTVSPLPGSLIEDPVFEEITDDEISRSQTQESDSEMPRQRNRQVTFSSVREVRQLSTHFSEQARIARSSYRASDALQASQKLPLTVVAHVALIFCILWFCANCSYQEAIAHTSPAAVNILSSSSGLFTLVLASIFQSSASDRFTVSKLFAVIMSIAGITLVTLSDSKSGEGGISIGAIWALAGAFLYSCYLIMLKHKIPDEGKMDIPMFFGLVGAFNFVLLWPGFFILHYSGIEIFELPKDATVWAYIVLNAVFGTVISEFLWLWGCYLTSSLTATLSLSLLIPLTMLVDVFIKKVHFSWTFFVGSIPSFASFFAVSLLSHYGDWDPIWVGFKRLLCLCRGMRHQESSGLDGEQNESLLSNDREEETNRDITRDEIEA